MVGDHFRCKKTINYLIWIPLPLGEILPCAVAHSLSMRYSLFECHVYFYLLISLLFQNWSFTRLRLSAVFHVTLLSLSHVTFPNQQDFIFILFNFNPLTRFYCFLTIQYLALSFCKYFSI
jgi:hypothetical protein